MPGMELTRETFSQLENSLDHRQQLALRIALGSHRFGLVPGSKFNCQGSFVKNSFEIPGLRCQAVLPSGRIIDVDESVTVKIPILYGEEYFLGVYIDKELHVYERDGVSRLRPVYNFSICSMNDLKSQDIFPFVRFSVKDGLFSLDSSYIPPTLFISESGQFKLFIEKVKEKLKSILAHSNFEEGEGKRTILRYLFLFNNINDSEETKVFISLTQELAQALEYYIIHPNTGKTTDIPFPEYRDIQQWLNWVLSFLNQTSSVLDSIELKDNSIDYEALLQQAKQELYERLKPELLEKIPEEVREKLYREIIDKIKDNLPQYLIEKLSKQKSELTKELSELLTPKLFDELYEKLYDALYVEPERDEDFIPLI